MIQQIDCTYSEPILFNGSTPSSTLEVFNFSRSVCTSSDSADFSLSTSSLEFFDLRFSLILFGLGLAIFALFFYIGTYYAKR